MIRSVAVLLLVIVVLLLALWLTQRRLIYFPSTQPVPPAQRVIPGARDATLNTSDGLSLGAWLIPPAGPDRRLAVLVANGNAGDRSMRAPLASALSARGFTVLLFDYRGYGANPGSPSESGLALDVRGAYRYLTDSGFPPERIIFYGESLGAAVVTELATEHRPAGLVLRSPFADLAAVASHHYPLLPALLLLRDRYQVKKHISGVPVPAVVILGSDDTIVPPEQSRLVAQSAPGPVQVVEVPGADHNDPELLAGDQLIDAIVALADTL